MPRVTRRPLAETDILEIWDYIADDSSAAADRWVDRLDEQFRVLAMQPMMGRVRDELAPRVRLFRSGGTLFSTCRLMMGSMSFECCMVRETSTLTSIQSSKRTSSSTQASAVEPADIENPRGVAVKRNRNLTHPRVGVGRVTSPW